MSAHAFGAFAMRRLSMLAGVMILSVGCSRKSSAPATDVGKADSKVQAAAASKTKDKRYALGEEVFKQKAQPACSTCHTLAAAAAVGTVGPNLDTLHKSHAQIVQAVTGGLGLMPAQGDKLSKEQIDAVAHYVVTARKAH